MRAAVHSNAERPEHGGGVSYCVALASALAATWDVDLFFPFDARAADLREIVPIPGAAPRIRREPTFWRPRLAGGVQRMIRNRAYDMVVVQSPYVPPATWCARAYALCEFPFTKSLTLGDRVRLKTFRAVIANSRYTAGWIERRWQRRASVLHPPVRALRPLGKQPYILAVGRFAAGGRSKRQLEMVGMFRRLRERGLRDWELHLAGFAQDRGYLELVRAEAAGLPVHIHLDLPRGALETLYGRSSIFWHATGAGIDAEREPQRMEHFGIVTVEAMSAGTVPIVVNGGGQPEIVEDGRSGLLWRTFDECVDQTWALIRDEPAMSRLSAAAVDRARAFDFPAFESRVRELFGERAAP